jgi:hypothetical protein
MVADGQGFLNEPQTKHSNAATLPTAKREISRRLCQQIYSSEPTPYLPLALFEL